MHRNISLPMTCYCQKPLDLGKKNPGVVASPTALQDIRSNQAGECGSGFVAGASATVETLQPRLTFAWVSSTVLGFIEVYVCVCVFPVGVSG